MIEASTESALRENDKRQDHVRALVTRHPDGHSSVRAFDVQDSSMLSVLAAANGLIVREPFAPTAQAGDTVRVLMLR